MRVEKKDKREIDEREKEGEREREECFDKVHLLPIYSLVLCTVNPPCPALTILSSSCVHAEAVAVIVTSCRFSLSLPSAALTFSVSGKQ